MTIQETLKLIEMIKEQLAPLQAQIDDLKSREDLLKLELLKQMTAENIKTVESEDNKYIASNATRKSFSVVDNTQVKQYLDENKLTEDYYRLDLTKIKTLAKTKIIPGIVPTETNYITIKEKVEAVAPEETNRQFSERINQERK